MKIPNLINFVLIALIVFMAMYFIHQFNQDTIKFKEVTKELKVKDNTIESLKADKAIIEYNRQIIKNELNDTVKDNEALRTDLNNAERTKLKITRDIVKERKYFIKEVAELEGKTINVVKFSKIEDCQIDLNFCLEKSKALEFNAVEYMKVNTELDLKNKELNHEVSGKMILLENERQNYKKMQRRNNLQKIGLVVVGIILVLLK